MFVNMLFLTAFTTLLTIVFSSTPECLCPPGAFHKSNGCQPCPAGTFQDQHGQSTCKPCPKGEASYDPGATSCRPCGAGSVRSENTPTRCKCRSNFEEHSRNVPFDICKISHCKAGLFRILSINVCAECRPGRFAPDTGPNDKCLKCPGGTYSLSGATKCFTCPKGEVPTGKERCGVCPPGKERCGVCPPGKEVISPKRADAVCTRCIPGFFKSEHGNFECRPCPAGTSSVEGASECVACPNSKPVLTKRGGCKACPKRKPFFMPIIPGCISCASGEFFVRKDKFCKTCPKGSFSNGNTTDCIKCPSGTVLQRDNQCRGCKPGTQYVSFSKRCVPCDVNFFCPGGAKLGKPCPIGRFARPGSSRCDIKCPKGTAFLISLGGCGKCRPGQFYSEAAAICSPCSIARQFFEEEGVTETENIKFNCDTCPTGSRAAKNNTVCLPVCKTVVR